MVAGAMAMPQLELTVRGRVVRRLEIPDGGLSIGREPDNDLVLDDPALSRRHARVVRRGATDALEDLGSRNRVFVDDRPVQAAHALSDGEVVTLGVYSFTYRSA